MLEIAKDLLQASDDLAATDPSASAKLAHEAYEIGRDLGIVRNHLDDTEELASALGSPPLSSGDRQTSARTDRRSGDVAANQPSYRRPDVDDEKDTDLSRILDRQRAMLPKPVELAPVRKPSRGAQTLTFESAPPKRSSWFGWMRPREWRHAG
ncbi:MAG: hypothetical protein ACR2RA_25135 [Geminicoccaceae bacterium]